ncbi:uncharacterized protein LOC127246782 [Andrographis paniculata]|uniref:uncharacterized protein LOC127246782 n=1 Tax=Andrographis paniculata TaxID=175694 RepID=UPI0021E7E4E9|nr:uncharacterized protein LOC127246782 [Andrographis paniculata]
MARTRFGNVRHAGAEGGRRGRAGTRGRGRGRRSETVSPSPDPMEVSESINNPPPLAEGNLKKTEDDTVIQTLQSLNEQSKVLEENVCPNEGIITGSEVSVEEEPPTIAGEAPIEELEKVAEEPLVTEEVQNAGDAEEVVPQHVAEHEVPNTQIDEVVAEEEVPTEQVVHGVDTEGTNLEPRSSSEDLDALIDKVVSQLPSQDKESSSETPGPDTVPDSPLLGKMVEGSEEVVATSEQQPSAEQAMEAEFTPSSSKRQPSKKRKSSAGVPGSFRKRLKRPFSKKVIKGKKSKTRQKALGSHSITAQQAMDTTHFDDLAEVFEYDILADRKFVIEKKFTSNEHVEVGFSDYLRRKGLFHWAVKLRKYCPKLVKEFYANLSAHVLDQDSPWFHKAYVRGKVFELSPRVINKLLKLPLDNPEELPSDLLKDSTKDVALFLSSRKSVDFGRKGLSASELSLRFQCLFRLCSKNILPTSNGTTIGSEMGKLMYSIDRFCPNINFGFIVMSKMVKFSRGQKTEGTNLPYPALITLLLKRNGIVPDSAEDVINLEVFQPKPNILSLHNDITDDIPRNATEQLLEARRILQEVVQEQAAIRITLGEHRQKIIRAVNLMPKIGSVLADEEEDPSLL